jgi:hypothetical protein
LLPYAAYLVWAATRRTLPRAAVWVPIVLNAIWAVDCAIVAFGGAYAPSAHGLAFLAVQVVTVLAFASSSSSACAARGPRSPDDRPRRRRRVRRSAGAVGVRYRARVQNVPPRLRRPGTTASTRCAACDRLDGGLPLRIRPEPLRLHRRQDFYRDPFWTVQRSCIVTLFLFCAGLGQAIALHQGQGWPRFWRRWAQVAGCALLVTLGSWFMFPRSYISFGVLHGIALMLIVARLTGGWGGWLWPLGAVALLLPHVAQHPFFDSRLTNWIGLVTRRPVTEDYVPLLPWLGVVWWGMAAGAGCSYGAATGSPARFPRRRVRWRHSAAGA